MRFSLLLALLLAGCGGGSNSTPSTPSTSVSPTPTAQAQVTASPTVLMDEKFNDNTPIGPASVTSNLNDKGVMQQEAAVCPNFGTHNTVIVRNGDPGVKQTFTFSSKWGIVDGASYQGVAGFPFGKTGLSSQIFNMTQGGFQYKTVRYDLPNVPTHYGWDLVSNQTFDHSKKLQISATIKSDVDVNFQNTLVKSGAENAAFTSLAFGADDGDFRQIDFRPDSATTFSLEAWIDCSVVPLAHGIPANVAHTLTIGSLVDHWTYSLDGNVLLNDYAAAPNLPRFKPAHIVFAVDGSTSGTLQEVKVTQLP